ncbi:porin [Variovorax sp. VNK109]|uniref:porin n=1 Tax=Variovorax sp. VNK109 TaxID=3400919 RepID=UPI003C0716FF
MKKTLIALAALAVTSVASAQSSVTLFGVVDATYAVGNGSIADRTRLHNSGLTSSRFGLRGKEDLGGGLFASFWLEAGMNNDDGSGQASNTNNQAGGATGGGGLTFNRRSTVSLESAWGELRLGRDYTPQFWNLVQYDPFGVVGVGNTLTFTNAITATTTARSSNGIGYILPSNLGGFFGEFQYHMGENLSNAGATADDGDGYGGRIGYAAGPFSVALALSRTDYAAGQVRQNNLGGAYNLGFAKLMAQISKDSAGAADGSGWLVGGQVPVGAGEFRLAVSQYKVEVGATEPRARKLSLGYVHNLSKRTALYATFARVSNSGGATTALNASVTGANQSSTGYDFGLRHSF